MAYGAHLEFKNITWELSKMFSMIGVVDCKTFVISQAGKFALYYSSRTQDTHMHMSMCL